ncbi:glycosyltransferase [Rhodophyticola sp.]|uniref:glycosyltransferase n=1 Tax=Rhodophyticola sp. TaxID=2680032 RepID=UPI003D2A9184
MLSRLRGLYARYAAHHKDIAATGSGETGTIWNPAPVAARPLPSDRRLLLRFLRDAMGAAPPALRWYLTGAPEWKAEVKARLGLTPLDLAHPLDISVFREPPSDAPRAKTPVTILLPVFNAFEILQECLDRIERHTDLPWHLIAVEDGSTDARVRPFLRDWATARAPRVTLLENSENLGFVGSVNRALEEIRGRDHPVILLNSDSLVPAGWASRIVAPLLDAPDIASVTPMSNDAEILSVPLTCQRRDLRPGEADRIDAVAQGLSPLATVDIPTGVGFCMALSHRFLRDLPQLDTSFGRGYGEEVDWCRKALAMGGRHVGLPGLFVEHRGGASFGTGGKAAQLAKNAAILSRRYPQFDAEVQAFLRHDPLLSGRLALAVGWAAASADGAVPIYLAHSLGGGAEAHLRRELADLLSRECAAIVLRFGGRQRVQVELHTDRGRIMGATSDLALVHRLLEPVRRRRIIYSCAVGDTDPMALLDLIHDLAVSDAEIEIRFHDFFPVSPSYCLLDQDGHYRGPVTASRRDAAHSTTRADGTVVTLADWQRAWHRPLSAAGKLVVYSNDSRAQVAAAYPDLSDKITVAPHPAPTATGRVPVPQDARKTVIGILGNIAPQKGAALICDLARELERHPGISMVLIGTLDPSFNLPRSVPLHGPYRPEDIAEHARHYGVTCWLIPSTWPETFSFTTHEALATGLPVLAFDIGAQGEAVAQAENGHPIGFAIEDNLTQVIIENVKNLPSVDP